MVKLMYVKGARGFPHYVVKEEVFEDGEIHRRILAQCENKQDAEVLIDRVNESIRMEAKTEEPS